MGCRRDAEARPQNKCESNSEAKNRRAPELIYGELAMDMGFVLEWAARGLQIISRLLHMA